MYFVDRYATKMDSDQRSDPMAKKALMSLKKLKIKF